MIVVDASVVVAALLSAGGAGARARERLRLDPDLHVPHLLDVEVAAALRRRVRLGQTDVEVATAALADLADLAALRWDHEPLLRRVWELRENVTAYDAVYVVLAELLDAAGARAAGQLCAATAASDVVDASVVLVARVVDGVTVTSDCDELRRLDRGIELVRC